MRAQSETVQQDRKDTCSIGNTVGSLGRAWARLAASGLLALQRRGPPGINSSTASTCSAVAAGKKQALEAEAPAHLQLCLSAHAVPLAVLAELLLNNSNVVLGCACAAWPPAVFNSVIIKGKLLSNNLKHAGNCD